MEVAERIAASWRSSTRTIYKSKWALFEKWCRENLVEFSTPSVKQVSDFFMYLYQVLNRHPSNIDGYRTAIIHTFGPAGLHISQSLDRTLCPVRALRYYLDQTKDLRGSQSLLFISFKKGHTSDIRPATLSSWLKQTILQTSRSTSLGLGPSQSA